MLLLLVISFQSCVALTYGVEITTNKGKVNGTVTQVPYNGENRTISRFYGLPYAKPPVGERRFAKPEMMEPWNGTIQAYQPSEVCAQIAILPVLPPQNSSEDCLYLNIYSPIDLSQQLPSEKKAVMVWIHGGAFVSGSGNDYDGTYLSLHGDVVVVTINYRLGAFGFLDTNGASPANLGLWDQHFALQWVQNNIEMFGGDKSNVTIFGESAGAISIAYQLISPQNNGSLFRRAILQSGGFNYGFTFPDIKGSGMKLAAALGCIDEPESITCMKSKSTSDILNKTATLFTTLGFSPFADGDFLPYDPTDLLVDYTQ